MSSKVEGASWLEEGADDDFDESFFGDFVKDCKDGDLRPCAPKKPLSNEEELAIFVERAFTFVHLTGCFLMYCSMMVNFAENPGISEACIVIYACIFTTILSLHELSIIYEMYDLMAIFLENMGFLYNHTLKGYYIIFIAFVNLSLDFANTTLQISSCAWMLFDGFALAYLSIKKPEWFPLPESQKTAQKESSSKDPPTKSYFGN